MEVLASLLQLGAIVWFLLLVYVVIAVIVVGD